MSKIALGRGLESLIPPKTHLFSVNNIPKSAEKTAACPKNPESPDSGQTIVSVGIEKISKNPAQMRKLFSKDTLRELAESIKLHGILEPLLLSKFPLGKYRLIAGERRLEAAKMAGFRKIPAIIREVSKQQELELALIENIQRENLNAIEEAKGYKMLASDFGLTQKEIAHRSGKSRSRVANFLRLLSLPIEVQNAISENKISEGHGRAILSLQTPEKQRALFNEILSRNLTVRQSEEKVKLVSVASHTRKIGSPRFGEAGKKTSPWGETQEVLSNFLSARVEIKKSGGGAKIIIECYAPEDFNKVVGLILKE